MLRKNMYIIRSKVTELAKCNITQQGRPITRIQTNLKSRGRKNIWVKVK